jgi:molecular chaperone HtpG
VAVFVRGMLIDDDARELLPRWAGFVGGVVESAELLPTASREDVQRGPAFEAAAARLTTELLNGLAEVARTQPEAWHRVLVRHNEALLGAAIADDRLFRLAADDLVVPTSEGDLPARTLFARGEGKAYVSLSLHDGFEEMLCRALKVASPCSRRSRTRSTRGTWSSRPRGNGASGSSPCGWRASW